MKRPAFRKRRFLARFAWLALLALLFQQVALASYACPTNDAPPPRAGMMAGCTGMDMPDADAPMLCDQHCLRDHATSTDLQAPQVPALGLPPVYFALADALLPPAHSQHYEDVRTCQADPPPAQRFCSLQI
ncbi:hypothetical protein [Stenotrophomonas sp. 24(2023)]|uniref:hypothetical protein n=1 Tax=Stenotrophomonas sp. 24(2023) TaxID=3068324 RepID=UPI0027E201E9|nr:hypothetical protein [Stenotrophomonas sp. 24(2023)]WMJ69177.1 hypothetical protein Q9R17_18700 [Stenotrophomonas sp. 24(2023)]